MSGINIREIRDAILGAFDSATGALRTTGGGGGVASTVTANAGANLNTSGLALNSTVAKDGTDITTPTAMPTGGAGIRGWLSAIWTKLNGNISVNGTRLNDGSAVSSGASHLTIGGSDGTNLRPFLTNLLGVLFTNVNSVGAIASTSTVYRTSITAPDIATPTVGTLTTAAGGSLTAVAHQVRVTGVNAFGRSLPVIPANNGLTATASGVIRIPIIVDSFTDFDIFLGTVADPLYLGRVTAAEVTSGVIITGAATSTANCAKTTSGATAGVVECRVLGTQRAASTDTIPFSFVMPATPVNCAGKQFVDFDVEVALTATPILPVIVLVPFFLNSLTGNYVQSDIVTTLNLSIGISNRIRLRYQVNGNTGVHLAVQSIIGVGASINMWSNVS